MTKEFVTKDGHKLIRKSRWIKIRRNYNPSKRNRLRYYITDGNGYREGQSNFDPSTGLFLDYFPWRGTTWAMEQFMRCGSVWCPTVIMWEEDDKINYISGIDSEDYCNPIMIELDECGEYVRVYEEEY